MEIPFLSARVIQKKTINWDLDKDAIDVIGATNRSGLTAKLVGNIILS